MDVCEFVASLLLYVGVVVDSLQKGEDCLVVVNLGGLRGIKQGKRQALLSYLKLIPNVVERVLSCHSICSDLRSHGRQPGAQQVWLAIKLGGIWEGVTRGGRRRGSQGSDFFAEGEDLGSELLNVGLLLLVKLNKELLLVGHGKKEKKIET